jgi:hypothetical protein
MNRVGISPECRAGMETRCEDRAGQQVQCLTSEPGSMWIHGLDDLPDAVRARLARSKYNLCPVCVAAEADAAGSGRSSQPSNKQSAPPRQSSRGAAMLKFHPLANVLPLMQGVEFDRLVADIAKRERYRKHHKPALGPVGDSLEDFK